MRQILYTCNQCPKKTVEPKGWWEADKSRQVRGQVFIRPLSASTDVETHLCGTECLLKFISTHAEEVLSQRVLDKVQGKEREEEEEPDVEADAANALMRFKLPLVRDVVTITTLQELVRIAQAEPKLNPK